MLTPETPLRGKGHMSRVAAASRLAKDTAGAAAKGSAQNHDQVLDSV